MQNNSKGLIHPKYRADIDGLRAVAVLAVVVFHGFPALLTGGFIGVDIFFVISGYLISIIIFDNLDRNRFNFTEFYARRIKRIFPTLCIVLIGCYLFGWLALTAPDFKRLGKHISSGAGFISNFIFLKESGYFDVDAGVKPLLHLWSLAIEEQFYIIWPLLVWWASKMRLNRLGMILCLGIALFLLNIQASHDPDQIAKLYYTPQTRFWELLVGAIVAHISLYNSFQTTRKRIDAVFASIGMGRVGFTNFRSILGVALLVVGFLCVSKDKPFPGWYALLPVLGAALVISAGAQAWINRKVLANRVLVWFGLISFPLYLWHWPLLSFARILEMETPSLSVRLALICLSVALAWLTKIYVENPIRFGQSSRYVVGGLVALMFTIAGAGYYTFDKEGLPARYGVAELKMEPGRYDCDGRKENSGCSFGKSESGKLVVVWGDSHAEQYTNALRMALGDKYRFIAATNGSCFMGDKVIFPDIGNERDCSAAMDKIKSLRGQSIYAVIRVQRWHGYKVIEKLAVENAVNDAITAYNLHPQKVIIMGASPDVDIECEVSNYYTQSVARKKICKSLDDIKVYVKSFIETTKAMDVPSNVHFIYPYEIACPNDRCQVIAGNISYFENIHHFSTDGALRIVPEIERLLTEPERSAREDQKHGDFSQAGGT